MLTLTKLKKVKTLEDLENLGIGRVIYDISYRGGYLGFYADDVAKSLGLNIEDLPIKVGAYCNYLGGGIRGSILGSNYNYNNINGKKAKLLDELINACIRVYEYLEQKAEIPNDIMEGYFRVNIDRTY